MPEPLNDKSRRQVVFDWLMGEPGYWGGTEEVARVDALLAALDTSPSHALPNAGCDVCGAGPGRCMTTTICQQEREARSARSTTRRSPELAERLESNWLHIGEFFASRNWPDTALGRAASDLNADIPRIIDVLREPSAVSAIAPKTEEAPLAYLVFCENDPSGFDYMVFAHESEADTFACGRDIDASEIVPLFRRPDGGKQT